MNEPEIRWGCINPSIGPENAKVRLWIKGENDRWYPLAVDRAVGSIAHLAEGSSSAVWICPDAMGTEATAPESPQEPTDLCAEDFLDDMGELFASGAAGVLRGVGTWVGYVAAQLDPKQAPDGW